MERTEKYLVFWANFKFGIKTTKVREITGIQELGRLDRMPPWIKGVLNLRGKAIVVTDLRTKLNLSPIEPTRRTCIIIAEVNLNPKELIGIIVDNVESVINIEEKDVVPKSDFLPASVMGMVDTKGDVIALLDLDALFGNPKTTLAPTE